MKQLRSVQEIWNKYQYILTPVQKKWGVVMMFMTFFGALLETMGVSVILPLVQVMINPSVLYQYPIVNWVMDSLSMSSDTELIWLVGIAVIFVYILKNMYLFLLSYVRIKYACKIQRELSSEMMESYMKRGYLFFVNTSTGELLRGMVNSIQVTYDGIYQAFKILSELLTVVCVCIYIMFSDFFMALVIISLAIVCLFFVVFGFKSWSKKCGEIYYKYAAVINQLLLQAFQGIKEVLVMHREKYYLDTYKEKYTKQQKGIIGKTIAAESPAYLIEGLCVTGLIVAVCIKTMLPGSKDNMVPQLATFAVAAFRILPSLGRISSNFNQFITCIPGINDTYHNFSIVRGQKSRSFGRNQIGEKKRFENQVTIENITWKYPNTDKNVLENVSFSIKKGQATAFVGPSGAGKTTLSDIILGLLIPEEGSIKVDNISILDIPDDWGSIIGFVPQNVYLLDDTIRRNVAFGLSDKEIDDDQVWRALKQAQMIDTVEKLAAGLDTQIGERGTRLSGGQRQRIAISRALYYNPDILVMDEATSALDSETEKAVMESIDALHKNKTLIIIAHRLSTIKNCEVIYEIKNGQANRRKYEELV